MPVEQRSAANRHAGRQSEAQGVDQLFQEQRDAVIEFRLGCGWNRPQSHLHPAPSDDFVAVYRNEFVQHDACPTAIHAARQEECPAEQWNGTTMISRSWQVRLSHFAHVECERDEALRQGGSMGCVRLTVPFDTRQRSTSPYSRGRSKWP
jgi:hypothetical protein